MTYLSVLAVLFSFVVAFSACGPSSEGQAQSSARPTIELTSARMEATETPVMIPTPSPVSPSPSPFPTLTPTPTRVAPTSTSTAPASPTTTVTLKVASVSSPVTRGELATLVAETTPGAQCSITVFYKSGASTASGLEPRTADDSGQVSWSWKVGRKTTPGQWRIVVTAAKGDEKVSETAYFTVQ